MKSIYKAAHQLEEKKYDTKIITLYSGDSPFLYKCYSSNHIY